MNKNTWPPKIDPAAYHGVAGEVVGAVSPHSEADDVALLGHFLAGVGNIVNRNAYFMVGGQRHHANLFVAMVGATSTGRKGSAKSDAFHVFKGVDDKWLSERQLGGMSSGEGLIWAVRDPIHRVEEDEKTGQKKAVLVDPGIDDKRLFVVETEFASVLKRMGKDTNTLSPVLRQAWDGEKLQTMTKTSPATATDAHITVISHITFAELHRELSHTESLNGFVNRFCWFPVRRSKQLPDGGDLASVDFADVRAHLRRVIEYAQPNIIGCMKRDDEARKLWHEVYGSLTAEREGIVGAVTARAAPQVMRIAMIYALLDLSAVIRAVHLQAALAVWRYCEDSAVCLFGNAKDTEKRQQDELRKYIASRGRKITERALYRGIRRYRDNPQQAEADLQQLVDGGHGSWEPIRPGGSGGKPTRIFCLADSPDFPIRGANDGDETHQNSQNAQVLSPVGDGDRDGWLSAMAEGGNHE